MRIKPTTVHLTRRSVLRIGGAALATAVAAVSANHLLLDVPPHTSPLPQTPPHTSTGEPPRKKLIQIGWDMPDTAFLARHWAQMEHEAPIFDGLAFTVNLATRHGPISSTAMWDATPWQRDDLRPAMRDLQSCHWTRFTDNFLLVHTVPGALDWFDDHGWAVLTTKFELLAWVAKEGGARGLCYDPEHYDAHPFSYDPTRDRSFPDTVAKVRQRGREVVEALARAYPDMVLKTLWLTGANYPADGDDWPTLLRDQEYGLFVAFVNGLLDGLPPQMQLVDGVEYGGYFCRKQADFLALYTLYRQHLGHAGFLIAPENKGRFRAQVSVALPLYLDMYLNEPDDGHWAGGAENPWYTAPSAGLTRQETLVANTGYALETADEYVWLYGEQCRWWSAAAYSDGHAEEVKTSIGTGRLWEQAMPGLTRQIDAVKQTAAVIPPFPL